MELILQDFRYALRQLTKSPGFTLVAIITLALGIGATTAVYSLANWIFLRPIPGANDDGRLVAVLFAFPRGYKETSYLDYQDFAERATAFSGLAGEARGYRTWLIGRGTPRELRGSLVSANYFSVLGVRRQLGRFFEPGDMGHGATPVAVLSYALWRDEFHSDPGIVGGTVKLNDIETQVVGVAASDFAGTERVAATDVWLPVVVRAATPMGGIDMYPRYFEGRASGLFPELIGRLGHGVTIEQARTQLASVTARLIRELPAETMGLRGLAPEVHRGLGVPVSRRAAVTDTLRILWLVAGAVTLIAVANVTNLLLFRAVGRRGEVTVRRALGASAARLVGQSLVEGSLLAIAGGVAAVTVAIWLVTAFRGFSVSPFVPVGDVPLDWRVLGFGLLAGMVTGVVVGLVPLLANNEFRLGAGIGKRATGSGRRSLVRNAVGVLQVASTLTLLVGALLLIGTLRNLRAVDLGFEPAGLSVFEPRVQLADLAPGQAKALRNEVVNQIRRLPGVTGVAPTYVGPFSGGFGGCLMTSLDFDNEAVPKQCFANVYITPEYFDVVGVSLLKGRSLPMLTAGSSEAEKGEIVISESGARRFFGSADPIGRVIEISGFISFNNIYAGIPAFGPPRRLTIVGLARDARWTSVAEREVLGPLVYRNLEREDGNTPQANNGIAILVRSTVPLATLQSQVERIVKALAPGIIVKASAMVDRVEGTLAEQRLFARVVGLLSALAVVLAGVGLYALVAFSVAQRTREFGIRIALGAQVREILDLVMWQGATVTGIGLVLGLGGAVALSRVLSHRLFGVTPLEPHIYLLAIALLVLLTLVASLVPARAATRVDPMVALKSE